MTQLNEQRGIQWVHIAIMVIAVLLGYSKVFGAGFMSWDDIDYIFNTPDIRNFDGESIKNWWTQYYIGNYQPLPVFTYAIDFLIGGEEPFVYHLDNITWHVADVLLLYAVIKKMNGNALIALFVALLFAMHPVQTESVSWVAARNKVMNGFFFLWAMYVYIGYVQKPEMKKMVWICLLGLAAYLCKLTAVTLPFALLAVDIWMGRPLNNKKVWLEKLPLILLAIPIGIINLQAQEQVSFLNLHPEYNFGHTIVFAGYAYIQYLFNLILPIKLSVLYPYPQTIGAVHILYTLLSVAIVVFGFIAYKKKWYVLAGGIAFYTVNIAVVLQFVQFGEVLMADRYLYLACIGVWYVAAYYAYAYFSKKQQAKTATTLLTVLCVAYSISTFARNDIWLSELNFWQSVVDKFPESGVAQSSLGGVYLKEGNMQEARAHIDEAVRVEPNNVKAWYNKGVLQLRENDASAALQSLDKAIAIQEYPKALFTRALIYQENGECDRAMVDISKVLEKEPGNARAHYIKADCLEQQGRIPEAEMEYTQAIQFDGKEPLFYLRRGLAYARQGKNGDAMRDMNTAIDIKADYAEAWYWRGMVKMRSGQAPCPDLARAAQLGMEQAKAAMAEVCK